MSRLGNHCLELIECTCCVARGLRLKTPNLPTTTGKMMMRRGKFSLLIFVLLVVVPIAPAAQAGDDATGRWSAQRANDWYAKQPWLVGANFIPSDAINELEMFQAQTFNPALIDKELGMGESIGMNTMRGFFQDNL